jgi:soluble lytic murein transglycosylase
LATAHLFLGDDPTGRAAFEKARARLALSGTAAPFLRLEFVEPSEWPIWEARLSTPEDLLLALGIWHEGEPAARLHFPTSDISLAYTGSRLLSSGGAHRSALRLSEIIYEGALARMPQSLIPSPLRRAVFPLPFGTLIAKSADRNRIDPYLLTALIREESRFDSQAVSAASARGLTQFVLSTAQRLSSRAGLGDVTAEDLHRPAVSIALGAAYLEELLERFEGREHQAVAAYNAGESQAELWQSYCFSLEPEEYLTKVGFPETRRYLSQVLASRGQYRDLYPLETFATR